MVRDRSRVQSTRAKIFGVSPTLHGTAHRLVEEIDFQNLTSGLSLTEQLYTARGS